MKLDLYGQAIEVSRASDGWKVFYLDGDGKKRAATDVVIPHDIDASEVCSYLDDLCHERATPAHPCVVPLD